MTIDSQTISAHTAKIIDRLDNLFNPDVIHMFPQEVSIIIGMVKYLVKFTDCGDHWNTRLTLLGSDTPPQVFCDIAKNSDSPARQQQFNLLLQDLAKSV